MTTSTLDQAISYADQTSEYFKKGDFDNALECANHSFELSKDLKDKTYMIRSLYLRSAVFRAQAQLEKNQHKLDELFEKAVLECEEAEKIYVQYKIDDAVLHGKIQFNLGAAHADNPNGNLNTAAKCYEIALIYFKDGKDPLSTNRTNLRLGKIYLLMKDYEKCRTIVDETRLDINDDTRLAMHVDLLEAHLLMHTGSAEKAKPIAEEGLKKAEILGAKADKERFETLLRDLR